MPAAKPLVAQILRPLPKTDRPQTHAPNRYCEYVGCDVKLSMYNGHTTCWAHTPTRIEPPRRI